MTRLQQPHPWGLNQTLRKTDTYGGRDQTKKKAEWWESEANIKVVSVPEPSSLLQNGNAVSICVMTRQTGGETESCWWMTIISHGCRASRWGGDSRLTLDQPLGPGCQNQAIRSQLAKHLTHRYTFCWQPKTHNSQKYSEARTIIHKHLRVQREQPLQTY